MKTRKLLIRLAVLVVLVAIGLVMMSIGRGHTVYIDNKTMEYNGTEYKAFYRVELDTPGTDKTLRLDARDRVSAKCIGQSFHMDLMVTDEKGGEPRSVSLDVKLPYNMDGPILSLPALLNDLPQEAWLDEFIPAPPSEDPEEIDLGMEGDLGLEEDFGGEDMVLE